MDAQYFVYTRGHDIANDYKLLFSPSEDFCPSDVRRYFLIQVRGLINLDTYVGNIEENPRWILSKKNGYILWGVGTMNKKISSANNTDYANRAVRGFFGIIAKESSVSILPFDLSYFEQFYSKYIVNLWTASKEDFKKKGVVVDNNPESCKSISAQSSNLSLNTDEAKTVLWEDSIAPEDFFASALALKGDFSCVYGLEEKSHAYNHDYRFYNVIVKGEKIKEERTYKVRVDTKREHIDQTILNGEDPIKPKKDHRLKLMFLGTVATFIVVALIVGRCSKNNQTNPQKSVSGDTVKTVKNIQKK